MIAHQEFVAELIMVLSSFSERQNSVNKQHSRKTDTKLNSNYLHKKLLNRLNIYSMCDV